MADEEVIPAAPAENSGSFVGNVLTTVMETADFHEKAWWQSKKFIAFLATEFGFFVLMGVMIYEQEMDKLGENVTFMVLAITAGFLATGFILGQAALDKYVRVAKITMGRTTTEGDT